MVRVRELGGRARLGLEGLGWIRVSGLGFRVRFGIRVGG